MPGPLVLTRDELAAFLRASQGIAGDDRPWPAALDRDEDEALRISALLAAGRRRRGGAGRRASRPAVAARARRLAARVGHVTALRHAFPAPVYAGLVGPWLAATGGAPAERRQEAPEIRRAR